MSRRRRPLHAILSALGTLVLAQATLASPAAAQTPPPLTATIFFKDPPANLTFDPALPAPAITIILQIENTSGAPVLTTFGFSATEFWRNLVFTHESGAIATNTAAAELHTDPRVGACLSRRGVLQVPFAIPVVPVEALAGPPTPFSLEFTVDQVFQRFPGITTLGRWNVDARLHVLTYTTGGAIISDCDQFPDTTLADVGAGAGVSRKEFEIVSNRLEFFVQSLDVTPPVVTPPANLTVTATQAGGATGSASTALAAFLAGGTATDDVSTPVRLTPQVGGVDADNTTVFPLGTTPVTFRYQDAAGNVGTATATVTVVTGKPVISGAITAKGAGPSPGVRYYDIRFTNTGTGLARNITVTQLTFRTLSGTGAVTYNAALSGPLPRALGDLAVGTATTFRVYLNVPSTVTRFSITESGQVKDAAGTSFTFSIGQATFP